MPATFLSRVNWNGKVARNEFPVSDRQVQSVSLMRFAVIAVAECPGSTKRMEWFSSQPVHWTTNPDCNLKREFFTDQGLPGPATHLSFPSFTNTVLKRAVKRR